MTRLGRVVMVVGVAWAVGLVLALLQFWPWPTHARGWLWFALLAPPAALVLEGLGELHAKWFRSTRVAVSVERRTEGKTFSWLRVGVVLLYTLVVGAALLGIAWGVRSTR